MSDSVRKSETLAELHRDGLLVLPNAWDAASAAIIENAGAKAVATTSGGVAWGVGRTDGHGMSRGEAAEQVRRIASSVDVPVTVDIEGGYGAEPSAVALTVDAVIEAGAVGINLEDSTAPGGPLFDPAQQSERIAAAREAAVTAGVPELFINVRTDVFLFGIGEESGRFDDVVGRTKSYADSGANGIFVPGLIDLDVLSQLVESAPLPVNVMAGPGAPSAEEFASVGVRRISLGTAVAQAAYGTADRAAREALDTGRWAGLEDGADYGVLNGFFA